jgi:hypothetical protein
VVVENEIMTFTFTTSYLALWAVVGFQALLTIALFKQLAMTRQLAEQGGLRSLQPLPIGTLAPEFTGVDQRVGRTIDINFFKKEDGAGLLLFLSPNCSTCKVLAASIPERFVDRLSIIAICQGADVGCEQLARQLVADLPFVVDDGEIARRYRVSGLPAAILIDPSRKILDYGHPKDIEELEEFIHRNLAADPGQDGSRRTSLSSLLTSSMSR